VSRPAAKGEVGDVGAEIGRACGRMKNPPSGGPGAFSTIMKSMKKTSAPGAFGEDMAGWSSRHGCPKFKASVVRKKKGRRMSPHTRKVETEPHPDLWNPR